MKEFKEKNKYEYTTYEELPNAKWFKIPSELILASELDNRRMSLFMYLSMYRGLNNRLIFSMSSFLEWANLKSDSHLGGVNDKIITLLYELSDRDYITFIGKRVLNKKGFIELEFNQELVYDKCRCQSFGIVYIDEIDKILSYKHKNMKDNYLNNNVVLLVFAFLRHAIFRTPNELKPEERTPEGIKERKKRCIEAYANTYKDIALVLGLSERTVSKAVSILEELGIITFAEPFRIKIEDNKYLTPYTIFANFEKREGNKLLTSGMEYAYGEIKRKEESIRRKSTINYHLKPLYKNRLYEGVK